MNTGIAETVTEDFNPEEAEFVTTLTRRAQWLERRITTSDKARNGTQHDIKEYNALLWALHELGVDFTEGAPDEQPPIITAPVEETWRPRAGRFYPGGNV